eukprot:PhM_4_TR3551/c0_g1_i1/m.46237
MLSSLDSFAKNLPGAKLAEFRFSHFLLNHRVQWYMLHCMTQPSVPEADLKTMWHLFMVLYEEHSKVEDVIMFPAVEKSKPDVHAMLKAQHTALDDAIKKVNDAMAASGSVDAARSALLELARRCGRTRTRGSCARSSPACSWRGTAHTPSTVRCSRRRRMDSGWASSRRHANSKKSHFKN